MRIAFLLMASAALVACGKKGAAPEIADTQTNADAAASPEAAPAGFPKMKARYSASYEVRSEDGGPKTMTLDVDGAKRMRFQFPHPSAKRAAAGDMIVGVFDEAKDRYLMFREGADAPKVAVVMPFEQKMFDVFRSWQNESNAKPTKVGSDSVAGLRCGVWEVAAASEGEAARQACVTDDGILLRAGDVGAEPEMIATYVAKGRLEPARFVLPEDYEVVDLGPCQTLMTEAAVAAQAGQQPDTGKMEQCQAISQKAAAVFADMGE